MNLSVQSMTITEFWDFVNLDENRDKRWELINGIPIEKGGDGDMAPSSKINSVIAIKIARFLDEYAEKTNSGYVTGADGGYRVDTHVFQPDVGYISKARSGGLAGGIFDSAPDLAVEVVSPNDKEVRVFEKARIYLLAGTRMVWLIFPDNQSVYVCTLESKNRLTVDIYDTTMTLTGGDVLPNFTLETTRIFPKE
ncbi:MAG TPA: Uma2 family endonuclease [Aggregatilineales bacterium]|nr:Uma2 family endonuclease [Aggregatilineales bacterium]